MTGREERRDLSPGAVFLRKYGILMLWFLVAWGMWRAWQQDPFNPALEGTARYGHNGPTDLPWGLGLSAAELALIYLALRPWSSQRSWWRSIGAAGALILLLPWTVLLIAMGLHQGSIFRVNMLWVAVLDLVALGRAVERRLLRAPA